MSVPAKTFEDLIVWQKAHRLVLSIYQATISFPKTETYGLTSQIRRSAVSVPANIAEGFRKSKAEKSHYLTIAHSSLEETRYYLILASDLNYVDTAKIKDQLSEVSRLLTGYSIKIES